jgi:hypothetical protein
MADVFISYARDNARVVRDLAAAVAGEGYSVWWDDALPPHLSYSEVITGEIGKAKAVIVVWSERAIASEWVRAEADLARNQKKLIQTSIDGRMPPMPFNQLHFVSIGDWRGEAGHPGWMRTKESLASLCRGEVAQPVYAFPPIAPQRPATSAPTPSTPGLRLALILVAGLLVLGLAGAAALWLSGAGDGPAVAADRSPVPSRESQPRLSAPLPAPLPAKTTPVVAAPRPAEAPVSVPVQPRRIAQPQVANMRRYCSGPGRGTPQCRQFRARMSQTR